MEKQSKSSTESSDSSSGEEEEESKGDPPSSSDSSPPKKQKTSSKAKNTNLELLQETSKKKIADLQASLKTFVEQLNSEKKQSAQLRKQAETDYSTINRLQAIIDQSAELMHSHLRHTMKKTPTLGHSASKFEGLSLKMCNEYTKAVKDRNEALAAK